MGSVSDRPDINQNRKEFGSWVPIESLSYRLYWLSNGLLVYPDLYRKLYSFIIQYTHLRIVVVEPKYILSAAE